jgi:hypothetical protein
MLPDPETHTSLNDRRSFIKMMAAAPLFVTLASRSLAETVAVAKAKPLGGNVYSRLGVRPFINGRGTWTYLSGSLELPEVREAAEQASRQFVDMFELQRAAGKKACGTFRSRVGDGDFGICRRDGIGDRGLHRRERSQEYLAVAGYNGAEA